MAIIYSYPEIPDVQGGDLLLISDTGAPNKPTRSVDIDDLAAYIGTVIGIGFWNLGTAPDSIFTTKMASIGQDANIASSKLNVYKTDDMTASVPHIATFNESSSNHSLNLWPSPGNNAADIYGSVSRGTFTGSGTVDQIIGINPISRHSGSGSVNFIQGTQATASLTGSGSVKTIVASYAKTFIEGTGSNNIENAFGAWNVVELDGLNDVDTIYGTYSNIVLTNGEVNDDAIGHFIDFDQVGVNTDINNAYYIHAKNDSLSVTGEKFFIKDETGIPSQFSNKLVLNAYGSGTFTGTATQRLAVDTNGNVIEIPIGSGPVDGSGTANYSARWIDTDTLGIGALYDNGTNVGIGTTSPGAKLEVSSTPLISGAARYELLITEDNTASAGRGGGLAFSRQGTIFGGIKTIQNTSNNDNTTMYFQTRGAGTVANRMVIDELGNVGIGTTSPARKLHVHADSGSAYLQLTQAATGTTSNDGFQISMGAAQVNFINRENGNMVFETNNAERMRITSAGNVGIGTTSPGVKLDIDDGAVTDVRIRGNQTSDARIGAYNFYNTAASDVVAAISADRDGANDAAALAFDTQIAGGGMTERMRITSAGNVGIGNGNPQNKLDIEQSAAVSARILATGATSSSLKLEVKGGATQLTTTEILANSSGALTFATGTTAGSERMRINSSGNVGIGTTSPSAKLEISRNQGNHFDTAFNDAFLKLSAPSTYNNTGVTGISMATSTVNNYGVSMNAWRFGTSGAPKFIIKMHEGSASGVDALTIDKDGNVGIGTTSPSQKLHVAGNLRVTGAYYDSNNLPGTAGQVLSSTGTATSWVEPSSVITRLIPYFQTATPGGSDTYTQSNNVVDFNWSGGSGTYEYILPSATAIPYRTIRFVNDSTITASDKIHITAPSGETIDGGAFYEINKPYNGCAVWSDGVQWIVIQAKA